MRVVSLDTETTGLTPHHGCLPFMIQACDGEFNYWWTGEVNPHNRAEVNWDKKELLDFLDFILEADVAVFHNAKFDIRMIFKILKQYNLEKGFLNHIFNIFEDTMLASHALCSGDKHGLAYLALKYLDLYNDNEHILAQKIRTERDRHPSWDLGKKGHPTFGGMTKTKWFKTDYWLDIESCLAYGLDDVEWTFLLWKLFGTALKNDGLIKPYNTRKKLLEVFYYLEDTGYHMYTELMDQEICSLVDKCERLRKKIENENYYDYRLDLDKDQDLKFLLHGKLELPVVFKTPSGQPSVKQEAIDYYFNSNPELTTIKDLKEYRSSKTRISSIQTYYDWVIDSRIHSSYWITGTRGTRQSVELPNLQNVDKSIRNLFGPPPEYVWLDFDLVNIEMRRWAYYVNNKELVKVFNEGGSVHLLIAETLYPKEFAQVGNDFKNVYKETFYQWVKNGNFSALYGAGEKKADATYRMRGAYQKIANRFPEVPEFTQRCEEEVLYNYDKYDQPCVTVDGGYRLEVPLSEVYKSVNYKVQGSAGWIMGEAMIEVYNNPLYKKYCRMVQQVHDSLVIELRLDDLTVELIESIKSSIEAAGLKYMPTNEASYDIVTHYKHPGLFIDNGKLEELI